MTVLPASGEFPTGKKNDFEQALVDGNTKLDEAEAAAAAAEATEEPSLSDVLKSLTDIVTGDDPEPAAPKPAAKPGEKPEEPAAPEEPASKKEIDALMATLAEEPASVQAAVRRALESGMAAKDAVEAVLAERNNIIAHAQLVSEVDALSKKYPSFSPEQLTKTLDHLSKLPATLADELTLEEVAARAIGADALLAAKEQPKPPAPKPGGKTPSASRPGHRLLAEAEVIGDATPGAPMDGNKPFDAGKGNSFNDLAGFILKKHGDDIMSPARK